MFLERNIHIIFMIQSDKICASYKNNETFQS